MSKHQPQISFKTKITSIFLALLFCYHTIAGDKVCDCTTADIEKEVSYLAKKLLEVTGKSEYMLEQAASSKVMIGACFNVSTAGVNLTCITPDFSPQEKGMITGDIILEINDINFVNSDLKVSEFALNQIVENMQAGDILKVRYKSGDSIKSTELEVRRLTHPGFTFKVSR